MWVHLHADIFSKYTTELSLQIQKNHMYGGLTVRYT